MSRLGFVIDNDDVDLSEWAKTVDIYSDNAGPVWSSDAQWWEVGLTGRSLVRTRELSLLALQRFDWEKASSPRGLHYSAASTDYHYGL